MSRSYDLIQNLVVDPDTAEVVSTRPACVIAVVRLALPLSYSRKNTASVTGDVTEGAGTRGNTLVITDDCTALTVSGAKESHVKAMAAQIKQSARNYLIEILPGDWVLAWMVNSQDKARDLAQRIADGKACNRFTDGFKFVGRVKSIRKRMQLGADGTKVSTYNLQAAGFSELETQIFYDYNMAEADIEQQDLGRWLAKVGLNIQDLFAQAAAGDQTDNVHLIVPAMVELFLGRGAGGSLNPTGENSLQAAYGGSISSTGAEDNPELDVISGGESNPQSSLDKEAPFAYLVPAPVGALLNKKSRSKQGGILAYADIMELLFGVQSYEDSSASDFSVFTPSISSQNGNQRFTGTPMLGAFLPIMQSFCNKPLWSVLQQWTNPVVNEMYTTFRVNAEGYVVPTLVLRQIPFTTNVLAEKFSSTDVGAAAGAAGAAAAAGGIPVTAITATSNAVPVTPFLTLPRWKMHGAMVRSLDIGRSDATRCNFLHVYGQNSDVSNNRSITEQLVNNPPIRDDIDIQRSGLHAFMTTLAVAVRDQVGHTPGTYMELVADHMMGSQFTLNGTLESVGIEEPICEGDNLEWDSVAYHIESYTHQYSLSADGFASFQTVLTLTNGMRVLDGTNGSGGTIQKTGSDDNLDYPIYPGLMATDNRSYDPGLSIGYDDSADTEAVLPTEITQASQSLKSSLDDFLQALQQLQSPNPDNK